MSSSRPRLVFLGTESCEETFRREHVRAVVGFHARGPKAHRAIRTAILT